MHLLITFVKGLILKYGYLAIFFLTTIEQFFFPIPTDIFLGFSIENGLKYSKVMFFVALGVILGASIGYLLGKHLGHPALEWLVGKEKVAKGEAFIKKWGMWGIIMAAFTPVPFKIVIWTAGILEMPFKRFILAVLIGHLPRYFLTAYLGVKFFETKFYAGTGMSAIILGAVQGLTEFFPISSSGHLLVLEKFLHLPVPAIQLMSFDIFLRGGSLIAILVYFWRDWLGVLKEIWTMIKKGVLEKEGLAFRLFASTIPIVIAGLIFGKEIDDLRSVHNVGLFFIMMSAIYFYISWKAKDNSHETVNLKNSILIGIAQTLSFIPGISRSGITMAAGLNSGLKREVAARFSFMLGAVAILAANTYSFFSLQSQVPLPKLSFVFLGTISSFFASLLSIFLLLKFLKKYSLRAFGIYLLLAGILILRFL